MPCPLAIAPTERYGVSPERITIEITELKIDRSFVHGLKNSERTLAIIEAVAIFGRILGKDVVAEEIETEQEMQAMRRVGCTHLQGYLFSRPVAGRIPDPSPRARAPQWRFSFAGL